MPLLRLRTRRAATIRPAALVCAALLLAASCGSSPEEHTGDAGSGQVRVVDVDARVGAFTSSMLAYFPSTVRVGPGDRVVFRAQWTGEPHGASFGRLVEAGLAANDGRARGAPAPQELASLPFELIGGQQKVRPTVSRECIVAEGRPPDGDGVCPTHQKRPEFTGTQPYYSSGFIAEKESWTLTLSDDIAPGTYRYFCSFHGPVMQGKVVVEQKGAAIPSQAEVESQADKERRELIDSIVERRDAAYKSFERARPGSFPFPAHAGLVSTDERVIVNEFIPFTIKAKVGEKVSWTFEGPHTVSFDVPRRAKPPAIEKLLDGSVERNQDAMRPFGGPETPIGIITEPMTISGGKYDKEGFLNSGLVHPVRPDLVTFEMTPSEPGTYRYECIIHPDMTGLITVSS